jgi:hypothetical protein
MFVIKKSGILNGNLRMMKKHRCAENEEGWCARNKKG